MKNEMRETEKGGMRAGGWALRKPVLWLPGDRAERDARLLGNLGDAKPSVV